MSLIAELKRRRVIRVSIAYIVVCWVILQVADVVFPAIPLPGWSMRVVLVVLVLAFPVVLLIAWIFQAEPRGTLRREPVQLAPVTLALLAAASLLIGSGLGYLWSSFNVHESDVPGSARPGVAVLPLKDMSPGGDRTYFSDGIHEELISRLSEIRHIAVTSRTSVERYRDSELSVPDIADELGVDFILEGSVRHGADRVRITVQLIDAVTDQHVWVRDFDKQLSMEELFDIQRDVSENVADLLRAQLTPNQLRQLARVPTDSLEAYDAHLKAGFHYRRYDREDLRIAIEHWHDAVELDPEFADAWSGLANGYMLAATSYGWMQPDEAIAQARNFGARAIELDPYDGGIISLVGDIAYWYDFDAETAESKYREAVAVDPHHIGNRLSYAYLLSTQGRHEESWEQIEFCLEKEPRAPHLHSNAAWRSFDAREYDRAIAHADIALLHDPGMRDAFHVKGYSLFHMGRFDEIEGSLGDHWVLKSMRLMHNGREDEARAYARGLLEEARRAGDLALVFAVVGDKEQAIHHLEKAIDERHRGALLMNTWELYDPMRADPRFQAAMRRAGFTND